MEMAVIKIGKNVKLYYNGKFYNEAFSTVTDADKVYSLALKLKSKENLSEEEVNELLSLFNKKRRVLSKSGLEYDYNDGKVYLAGFNTPIPNKIVELIEEYNQKGFPVKSIVNFWKLLMLNPDERIRTRLFDFLDVHDFVITDNGYIVAYKAVYRTEKNKFLSEFVTNNYIKVKKDWKCNPDKYVVYSDNGYYRITKKEIAEKNNLNVIGSLKSLYESIISGESDTSVFTDMYSQTMKIRLGQPVKIDRSECESNPYNECAKGLHVGATKYVENYANENSIILMCLVNPANVVAVPFHDCSKIRVCEYFPFAVTTFTDRKIDAIQEHYFEFDYINYEKEELERMLEAIRNEEMWTKECPDVPEPEYRSFEELQKIVESRIVDINTLFP